MGRITKPGAPSPAEIKRRTREAQNIRKQLLEEGIAPKKDTSTAITAAISTKLSTPHDPTLLETIQWALGKAVMGFTYRQISAAAEQELGYYISTPKIRSYVEKEMARRKDPLVREIRKMEDARLDFLLTKLEGGVNSGDVSAIHEARLISESRRRMFGADMPTNVRVTGEVEHKLDPAVTKMIEESKERIKAQQVTAALEDPAIIDAEVVDDEVDYRDEPYDELAGTDDVEFEVEDL